MEIDTNKTDAAIAKLEADGKQVTITAIATLTGYKYYQLYTSHLFHKYVSGLTPSQKLAKHHLNEKRREECLARLDAEIAREKQEKAEAQAKSEQLRIKQATPTKKAYLECYETDTAIKYSIKWRTNLDDEDLDDFAYVLLKIYNQVSGRTGDMKLKHEALNNNKKMI